jgi:hypothetical protein
MRYVGFRAVNRYRCIRHAIIWSESYVCQNQN